MRLVLKVLVGATVILVLVMLGVIGDLVLNKRRIFYAMLGRDGVVVACTPVLVAKLKASGFEPSDVELGETPDITIATTTGKTLTDTFTFLDGASQTRVDGMLACAVKGGTVTVDVRTRSTPVRAT